MDKSNIPRNINQRCLYVNAERGLFSVNAEMKFFLWSFQQGLSLFKQNSYHIEITYNIITTQ